MGGACVMVGGMRFLLRKLAFLGKYFRDVKLWYQTTYGTTLESYWILLGYRADSDKMEEREGANEAAKAAPPNTPRKGESMSNSQATPVTPTPAYVDATTGGEGQRPKVVTHSQLATILGGLKGATILSLTWIGGESARFKRDHGRITKVSRYSGMVNPRYDRKKAKELGIPLDQVVIKPVTWREREGQTPLLRHTGNGTRYIEFYPASGGTDYTLDGTPCQRGDVTELMKPPSKGGGVVYRTPKLTSILAAKINKVNYLVVAD